MVERRKDCYFAGADQIILRTDLPDERLSADMHKTESGIDLLSADHYFVYRIHAV